MTEIALDALQHVVGGRDCTAELNAYRAARRAQGEATDAEVADQLKNPRAEDRAKWNPTLHAREEEAYARAGEAWKAKQACLGLPTQ